MERYGDRTGEREADCRARRTRSSLGPDIDYSSCRVPRPQGSLGHEVRAGNLRENRLRLASTRLSELLAYGRDRYGGGRGFRYRLFSRFLARGVPENGGSNRPGGDSGPRASTHRVAPRAYRNHSESGGRGVWFITTHPGRLWFR